MDGLIRLMDQDEIAGPVNLGNPDERSIKEIAELVLKLTDSSSEIIYKSLPQDDPVRRRPDISVAKRDLGWEPTQSVEEGLPTVVDYFRPLAKVHSAPAKMPR